MNSEQARELLQKYRLGLCSAEEAAAVESWYASLAEKNEWNWSAKDKEAFRLSLKSGIDNAIREQPVTSGKERYSFFFRVAAAASIMAILVSATWLLLSRTPSKDKLAIRYQRLQMPAIADADPGKYGAVLTLADGKKIVLDTAADGTLAIQGTAKVVNKNGSIVYNGKDQASGVVAYNTVTTPRGRQFQIVLSDGTKVWLNAASSIRYPVVFSGAERRVEIEGEAYFEVEHAMTANGVEKIPFIVKIVKSSGERPEVKVLGTHFNISAYEDEPDARVTLLEGSVKITGPDAHQTVIKPGQQARITGTVKVMGDVDLDEVIAWKNGLFQFRNADIQTIMRQAERWYDIKVSYPEGVPSDILNGGMPRNVKLSEFLKIMEYSDINVKINNDVLTITP